MLLHRHAHIDMSFIIRFLSTCRAAVYETGELLERPIRVEVQVLPKIQPFTIDLEGVEDQLFSVQCNATGKPAPTYTWIKDSEQKNLEEQGDR